MKLTGIILLVLSLSSLAESAFGGELFVPPGDPIPIRAREGNFLVGATTNTSFTFAVPSDMVEFTAAKVVLLPSQTGGFVYEYDLSIAQNSELHGASTFGPFSDSSVAAAGRVKEIDVSTLFTEAFAAGVNPGADYIGFNWNTFSSGGGGATALLARTRVLGCDSFMKAVRWVHKDRLDRKDLSAPPVHKVQRDHKEQLARLDPKVRLVPSDRLA